MNVEEKGKQRKQMIEHKKFMIKVAKIKLKNEKEDKEKKNI